MKMTGPYEYVPPVYWLADTQAGGAYGYNTETSPGPAIPTLESVKRFIPERTSVADRRRVELPCWRRALYHRECFHGRTERRYGTGDFS